MAINQTQADWVRTALRLPQDVHKKVHEAAKAENRTFNAQIVATLKSAVELRGSLSVNQGAQQ
jgi:hypothetical protein